MSTYQPQRYAHEGGLAAGHTALLSPWASYVDIEPRQWQRLYDWLLPPYRSHTDLFILHDRGRVLTVNPVYARAALAIPDTIANPAELAPALHARWGRGTVVILERGQYQSWLDDIQRDAWLPGDDLLAYGLKIKDLALRYAAEGIVLYPSPLDAWRDVAPDFLRRVGRTLAPDGTQRGVLFAVYDGREIWTSLVLTVRDGQVHAVTTLPAESMAARAGSWRDDYVRLIPIAERMAGPLSLGVFCERPTFETLGISPAYWPAWLDANGRGDVISVPAPLSAFGAAG